MKIPPMAAQMMPDANAVSDGEKAKIKQSAKNFEALFINEMVNEMRKTVHRSGLVPESQGEQIYQSMLDSQYAQKMADSEQIGLSKILYEQLLRSRLGR